MIGLHSLFPKHQFSDWLSQLQKELKEDEMMRLQQVDPIENITLIGNGHQENSPTISNQPGSAPYLRGTSPYSNQWKNISYIQPEQLEADNKQLLDDLMNGTDCIRFDLRQTNGLNLKELTKGIQFEFIQSQWVISNKDQWQNVLNFFNYDLSKDVIILYDHFEEKNDELLDELVLFFASKQQPFLHINGFAYHECGANAAHEIGFCLAVGNEYLELLIEKGFTIDQAAACLFFSVGIGFNYFIEVSKTRSLRWGWSSIIAAYEPHHDCSYALQLNAEVGWINKSLKDPNTNYLRQTAEAMSAVLGGTNGLLIYPFDMISTNGVSTKSNRMARTIPLMLQEESFLNQVIDPLGGSYTIEQLTLSLSQSGWKLFQKIHELNGPRSKGIDILSHHLTEIREKRIKRIESKETKLIGINCFESPKEETNAFLKSNKYMSFEFLHLENHI